MKIPDTITTELIVPFLALIIFIIFLCIAMKGL